MVAIAFYKGPPSSSDLVHTISHELICWWTDGPYSHCELVIDGWCYSASARDGGVRAKQIDLASGRWDVIELPSIDTGKALAWFLLSMGDKYDWAGAARFVIPLLPQRQDQHFCSEAVAAAIGLPSPHRFSPNSLYRFIVGVHILTHQIA